jgi:hypothetical protein
MLAMLMYSFRAQPRDRSRTQITFCTASLLQFTSSTNFLQAEPPEAISASHLNDLADEDTGCHSGQAHDHDSSSTRFNRRLVLNHREAFYGRLQEVHTMLKMRDRMKHDDSCKLRNDVIHIQHEL